LDLSSLGGVDPGVLRTIERLFVCGGGIFIAFLGYRLFVKGIDSGPGKLQVNSSIAKFVLSGKGPGLFFMAFGSIILIVSLLYGGASETTVVSVVPSKAKNAVPSEQQTNKEQDEKRDEQTADSTVPVGDILSGKKSIQVLEIKREVHYKKPAPPRY
jgi:hypothetical protein